MSAENNVADVQFLDFRKVLHYSGGAGLNPNRLEIPPQMLPDKHRM